MYKLHFELKPPLFYITNECNLRIICFSITFTNRGSSKHKNGTYYLSFFISSVWITTFKPLLSWLQSGISYLPLFLAAESKPSIRKTQTRLLKHSERLKVQRFYLEYFAKTSDKCLPFSCLSLAQEYFSARARQPPRERERKISCLRSLYFFHVSLVLPWRQRRLLFNIFTFPRKID